MPAIACYLRVSSQIQADANGTDSQRHAIRAWLQAHGHNPDTDAVWHEDLAISGASENRPAWQDLLTRARTGEYRMIVCYSLSRAGRSTRALLDFTAEMENAGIQLVFIKEAIDLATPTGRLFMTILAALAEFEREQMRERISAGAQARIAAGKGWGGQLTAKISIEQWRAIYERHKAGERPFALAKEFGIGGGYMCRKLARFRREDGSR